MAWNALLLYVVPSLIWKVITARIATAHFTLLVRFVAASYPKQHENERHYEFIAGIASINEL